MSDAATQPKKLGPKAALAGVLLVALAGGAATTAAWRSGVTLPGIDLSAGGASTTVTDERAVWDVSPDRAGADGATPAPVTALAGHQITAPENYRVIPGDHMQVSDGLDVHMKGDNFTATITVGQGSTLTGELADGVNGSTGVDASYAIYDADNLSTPLASGVPWGTEMVLDLATTSGGDSDIVVDEEKDGAADLYVVSTLVFDPDTTNLDLMNTDAALSDADISFRQADRA